MDVPFESQLQARDLEGGALQLEWGAQQLKRTCAGVSCLLNVLRAVSGRWFPAMPVLVHHPISKSIIICHIGSLGPQKSNLSALIDAWTVVVTRVCWCMCVCVSVGAHERGHIQSSSLQRSCRDGLS